MCVYVYCICTRIRIRIKNLSYFYFKNCIIIVFRNHRRECLIKYNIVITYKLLEQLQLAMSSRVVFILNFGLEHQVENICI